jgi:hypothetical protein
LQQIQLWRHSLGSLGTGTLEDAIAFEYLIKITVSPFRNSRRIYCRDLCEQSDTSDCWVKSNARVLIITDRTELDEQIEKVFFGVSEEIYRTKGGADLIAKLNATTP